MKKQYFSKLKNDYPADNGKERRDKIIEIFNNKNGRDLTQQFFKKDLSL